MFDVFAVDSAAEEMHALAPVAGAGLGADGLRRREQQVLQSDDRGSHWASVGDAPPCHPDDCAALTFADRRRGYVYAPGFAETDDGGRTWQPTSLAVRQVVAAGGGPALRLLGEWGCPRGAWRLEVEHGHRWEPLAPPRAGLTCPLLLGAGPVVVLVQTGRRPAATVSSDGGATWTTVVPPCRPGLRLVDAAVAPGGALAVACAGPIDTGRNQTPYQLAVFAGRRWRVASEQIVSGEVLGLAAQDERTLVLVSGGPHVTNVSASRDGGNTFVTPLQGGPRRAYVLPVEHGAPLRVVVDDNQIFTSADGGSSYDRGVSVGL